MRLAAVIALLPLAAIGCGGDDTCLTCDDAGSAVGDAADARANDATTRDAGGASDASGDGAIDGALDGGDAGPVDLGRPAVGLVSAGTVCTSPKYRMIVSLGQGPGGSDSSASPKYRLKGGVVGATQTP
jgi:hypothetical protein